MIKSFCESELINPRLADLNTLVPTDTIFAKLVIKVNELVDAHNLLEVKEMAEKVGVVRDEGEKSNPEKPKKFDCIYYDVCGLESKKNCGYLAFGVGRIRCTHYQSKQ